jgi:hypothetical protein
MCVGHAADANNSGVTHLGLLTTTITQVDDTGHYKK